MDQQDFDAFTERESLQYMGLDFLPRADGSLPTLREVAEYLRARSIMAGVAEGSRFGSPSPVVANLGVLPGDAVAVVIDRETFGRGQDAEAFLHGLAYTVNTCIVMNEEVAFLPNGEVDEFDPEEVPEGLDRSLHMYGGDDPAPAYLALLEQESPGSLGYTDGNVLFVPAQGYMSVSTITAVADSALPFLTFTRSGEARWTTLALTDSGENDVVVRVGPSYDSTFSGADLVAPGSPLDLLRGWVTTIPTHSTSEFFDALNTEDVPERVAKKLPHAALQAARDLLAQAETLSRVPVDQFLAESARAIGLGEEQVHAVSAFEKAPLDTALESLSSLPMTVVEPRGKTRLIKSLSEGGMISATHQSAKKDSTKNPRSLRVRLHRSERVQTWIPLVPTLIAAGFGIVLVASLVSERAAQTFDMVSTSDWVTVWVCFGITTLFSLTVLLQAPAGRLARKLLRKAHADGVYPYET